MAEGEQKTEKVQLPFVFRDGRNGLKKEVEDRREELVLLINDLGFFKSRKLAKNLAQKYRVSWQMIYKDFNWIKGHVKPVDLREIKIDLRIARDRALSESLDLLATARTSEEKLKAIAAVIASSKHYREDLEAWGEKEKVAEKVNVTGPAVFNLIEKSVEEIKNERNNNKSKAEGNAEGPGRPDSH